MQVTARERIENFEYFLTKKMDMKIFFLASLLLLLLIESIADVVPFTETIVNCLRHIPPIPMNSHLLINDGAYFVSKHTLSLSSSLSIHSATNTQELQQSLLISKDFTPFKDFEAFLGSFNQSQ